MLDNFDINESKVAEYLYESKGIKNSYSWSKEKIELLFQPNFKVIATKKRNAPKGCFVAQVNENTLNKNKLKTGVSEVIISHNIKNTKHIFKTSVKLQKYPEKENSDKLQDGFVALDQTIRDAIGCDKNNSKLEEKDYTVFVLFPKTNLFKRLKTRVVNAFDKLTFDKQSNIVRVFKATPNDMEINICRLAISTMQSIGIEDGDKIIVKSISGKIIIRALAMNEKDRENRKDLNYVKEEGTYQKLQALRDQKKNRKQILRNVLYEKKTEAERKEELKSESLAMIFLDYDARLELGINPGDPVTICRSNRFATQKNVQGITVPLLLTFLGIGLNLKNTGIEWVDSNLVWISIGFYVFCSFLLIMVNLLPIRNKFK